MENLKNIFFKFLIYLVFIFSSYPKSIKKELLLHLKLKNYSSIVGCLSWIFRYHMKVGRFKTRANPANFCFDKNSISFIFNLISTIPIEKTNKHILNVSIDLWEKFDSNQYKKINNQSFSTLSLRNEIRDFISIRIQNNPEFAKNISLKTIAKINQYQSNQASVIQSISSDLSNYISKAYELKKNSMQLCNQETDKFDLMKLIKVLYKSEDEIFLCGKTLFNAVVYKTLFDKDRIIDIGCLSTRTKILKLKNWEIINEDYDPNVTLFKNKSGLKVRLWYHNRTKDNKTLIRKNQFLKWTYSAFTFSSIRIGKESFIIPEEKYFNEEFGKINTSDRLFGVSELEAKNASLMIENSETFMWLLTNLKNSLARSDRYTTTIIINLFKLTLNLDYNEYLPPKKNIIKDKVSYNSRPSEHNMNHHFKSKIDKEINLIIKNHLKSFQAKNKNIDESNAANALLEIKELFDHNNVSFFLIGGTLLGAAREKKFISSDYDIDLGIFKKGIDLAIIEKVINANINFKISEITGDYFIKIIHVNGTEIDIFIHDKINGMIRHRGRVHEWYNETFSLGEIVFLKQKFLVPENYNYWLNENYGHWNKPVLFFNVSYDTPNRKFVHTTVDGIYHLQRQMEKSIEVGSKMDFLLAKKSLVETFKIDHVYM